MTKISDLTSLTGAAADPAADLFPIVDMSEAGSTRNKKITPDEVKIALDLDTSASPQFTAINLGHASDTTITRVSAGVAAIEGVNIVTTAGGVTFAADIVVPDEAYDATAWNGSLEAPTKNAIRDKIESLAPVSIEALDEGISLTAAITSIDFVGAGVVATNVGGDVTVTIAGGGGYNAENARDDIGAALVEGTGIDITVDDGADTITIAAKNAYEGGPVTAATTADLATWVNQGTSTVADGTGAMILKPQVDGFVHGREKAAPATPYDIYMKVDFDFLSSAAATTAIVCAAGILMRDNSDGEILTWAIYYERIAGDEQNTYGAIAQRWTNPTTFSATPLLRFNGRPWPWLRVNNNGTTITFYVSPDGKNWTQAGTETIATFIDTIDRIGVVGVASANATEAVITVPYFSTTAPS